MFLKHKETFLSIGNKRIFVEVASCDKTRQIGLMNRQELSENSGMLFIFPDSNYRSFWMKRTPLPLSIAYANKLGTIIEIKSMEPLSLKGVKSSSPSMFALEMNKGWFKKNSIRVGDKISFPEYFLSELSGKNTKMNLLKEYIRELLNEKKWADFNAPQGQTINLTPEDFEDDVSCPEPPCPEVRDLDDEIFDLIQTAYADVELEPGKYGNAKVRSPSDLPAGYTIMQAANLDSDPEPDFFRGSKMRAGRSKLGIVGHDGSAAAIQKYLEDTAEQLKSGAIAEMSGKIAHIMITRHGVPAVVNHAQVESMLGKPVEWMGKHPEEKYASRYGSGYDGWYSREIAGTKHMKILLGGQ